MLSAHGELIESVSTHSRAEAAAICHPFSARSWRGFNTQQRGGGCPKICRGIATVGCFNTQPRGGGCNVRVILRLFRGQFQHTAARRRLPLITSRQAGIFPVSTHSRAEAAANSVFLHINLAGRFQHTAARRRLRNHV